MTRADSHISLRVVAPLKSRLVTAANMAGRSIAAEISWRLDSSFAHNGQVGPQQDLLVQPTAIQADQIDAAARVFAAAMLVAERMRIDERKARQFAVAHTRRLTGVDWEHELAVATMQAREDERLKPGVGMTVVDSFLDEWQKGELSLPWLPSLSTDAHAAFQRWADRHGHRRVYIAQFIPAATYCGRLSSARKRWRYDSTAFGPAMFVVPVDAACPLDRKETEWLGECVDTFRKAAKRARLNA